MAKWEVQQIISPNRSNKTRQHCQNNHLGILEIGKKDIQQIVFIQENPLTSGTAGMP